MIHKSICNYVKRHGSIDDKYFNEQTVGEIIRGFSDWKMATLQGRFNYKRLMDNLKQQLLPITMDLSGRVLHKEGLVSK